MDIKDLRRELHRRAELSFEERRTAETIGRALTEAAFVGGGHRISTDSLHGVAGPHRGAARKQ